MPAQIFFVNNVTNGATCLAGLVCANGTFISIYGVVFTIVISLGVYIYGLQDRSEKITLIKNTDIRRIIINGLGFFVFSFLSLPSPLYEFFNFLLVGFLLLLIFAAFKEVIKFNENELSGERAVRKFKEEVIQEKLIAFEELKKKNDMLTKILQDKEVERFLLNEEDTSYNLIRSQKAGYITNVDLEILFSKEIGNETSELREYSYYIPYTIASGNQVGFDDVILGIKNKENISNRAKVIDYDKLSSYISIKEEFENPQAYLQAEIRSYYPEMFSLITLSNSKGLELKLEEFSRFVNLLVKNADSYSEIIQFISDDIIFPLQKYAFKNGDTDTIRKITSFSLRYIREAMNQKLMQTYNIFFRNFISAFYEASRMENKSTRGDFYEIYFRWLTELSKYSLKSKLQKNDSSYVDYALVFLSTANGMLKISFDNKDKELFLKTLSFLNNSFVREDYEHGELLVFDDIIKTKKAVIFGFTSWVYKYYEQRKDEDFYKIVLEQLFLALKKDGVYYYADRLDDLNYYLAVYLKATEISDKNLFSWDTWGMPEGRAYTVTVRGDLKKLLIDRLIEVITSNRNLVVEIKDKNYSDELAQIKEGPVQFDPFLNKKQSSFYSSAALADDTFDLIKSKIYKIFSLIEEKYEEDVRVNLIEQPLDKSKFDKFAKENVEAYSKARVMHRVGSFINNSTKKEEGFGYNVLLPKGQFVENTNIHYIGGNQFGEDLARSEDNKILELIYSKVKKIPLLGKEKVEQTVSSENDLSCVVLWIDNYFNIEDTNQGNFKPHWQEENSKQDRGPYYQGSINGVSVYIVYKFREHKSYPDSLFLFKKEAFIVEEFALKIETEEEDKNIKVFKSDDTSVYLSVTNLSDLEDERKRIVEKWITDDSEEEINKEDKITELKTNVVFKFFKGINGGSLKVDQNRVKIFKLE